MLVYTCHPSYLKGRGRRTASLRPAQVFETCLKDKIIFWTLVAHACNPSYSGGREQEDHGSKPAQVNSLRDPISKTLITEKGLAEWLKV
jgi:hypothetical protein